MENIRISNQSVRDDTVSRNRMIVLSLIAWLGVWLFWFSLTQHFHPTRTLAVIVTTSLVVAFATATFWNQLYLIPKFWVTQRFDRYVFWLAATMIILTAIALAVIRISYFELHGPDADPYGMYKHYAIDLFGMAVHVIMVMIVVKVYRRLGGF